MGESRSARQDDRQGRQPEDLTALTERIMEAHGERDLEFVMRYMDEHVLWIGALQNQYIHGKKAMREVLELEQDVPVCTEGADCEIAYRTADTVIVTGRLNAYTDPKTGYVLKQNQRLTFVYQKQPEGWRVVHLHVRLTATCRNKLMKNSRLPKRLRCISVNGRIFWKPTAFFLSRPLSTTA